MKSVVEITKDCVQKYFKSYPTLSEFILSGIDDKSDDNHIKLNIETSAHLQDEIEKLFGGK